MPLLFPLILVALGGAGLVILRGRGATLGALLLQWLGLAWAVTELSAGADALRAARTVLGLSRESAVEFVTAAVCGVILAATLRALVGGGRGSGIGGRGIPLLRPLSSNSQHATRGSRLDEYLLPVAVTLLGGLAGVGFAGLFRLGASAQADLVFYWVALAGALTLVLDGAREPVKVAAGLLALLNATALLVYTLSIAAPGPAVLGLMAVARIALAGAMAYGWALLVLAFGDFSLEPLFTWRDAGPSKAIVVAGGSEQQAEPRSDGKLVARVQPVLSRTASPEHHDGEPGDD
jgi:hypothetical protein